MWKRAKRSPEEAQTLEVKLDNSVLRFLAERIRTNVRRLEGALMRVASFTSLSGYAPSPEKIEQLLKDILQGGSAPRGDDRSDPEASRRAFRRAHRGYDEQAPAGEHRLPAPNRDVSGARAHEIIAE
jgi:hypothetical protein